MANPPLLRYRLIANTTLAHDPYSWKRILPGIYAFGRTFYDGPAPTWKPNLPPRQTFPANWRELFREFDAT
jgi:hypothetical protein